MPSRILYFVVGTCIIIIVICSFVCWRKSKENKFTSFFSLAEILLSASVGLCSLVAGINPQIIVKVVMPEFDQIIQENIDLEVKNNSLSVENNSLKEENDDLRAKNSELIEQIENMESAVVAEDNREKDDTESVNLLEMTYFDQSDSNTFRGFKDVDGGKDNAEVIHGKGFIYIGDHYYVGHRTYKLNGLYETVTGTIALPFDERDTKAKCTVRILDEKENVLYSGEEITGGVDPQKFEIDVNGVDEIKFEFITTEGTIQVGVYDVRANT